MSRLSRFLFGQNLYSSKKLYRLSSSPVGRSLRFFQECSFLKFMKVSILIYAVSLMNFSLAAEEKKEEPPSPLPLILDMVHHNPGGERYKSAFNSPEYLKQSGFNGKVYYLFDSPMLAITWDSVDPEICPEGSEYRKWVEKKAADLHAKFAACKKAGIKVYAMSDLILLPKTLVDMKNLKDVLGNPANPEIEKYLRLALRQVFRDFPDFDGLVVRIGETYLQDAPYFYGKIDKKTDPEKTIIPLLKILRDEVCVKAGKTLIFRTWLSFDTKLGTYMIVSNAIEPHPNLYISIKHCEGDFHRSNPFSKVLGKGRHKEIIEVQCAREYEGKGAYPNYIAHGVIDGFEEHQDLKGIKSIKELWETGKLYGVWTWSRGGGWNGPYIKDEMWCDLNAWVMAQWANHPEESEETIFYRYAEEKLSLSKEDAAKFRKLALLSEEAVVRGRNSLEHDMMPFWTRDEGIGWPRIIGDRERNCKEKDEAVAMWQEIVELAKSIKWKDQHTANFAISSSLYGLYLYEIYRALVYMEDCEYRKDKAGVKKWIAEYDKAWEKYNALSEKYPDVLATLYKKDYKVHLRNPADQKVNSLRRKYGLPMTK